MPVPLCPSQMPCLPHILLILDFPGLSRTTSVTQRMIIFVPNNFKDVNFYNIGLLLQKCFEMYLQDCVIVLAYFRLLATA